MIKFRLSPAGSIVAAVTVIVLIALYFHESTGGSNQSGDPALYTGEPRKDLWWMPLHETFVSEAAQDHRVIFYGDSIFESFRGTQGGSPSDWCSHNAHVFNAVFAKRFDAISFGAAGDQTHHLLWRLTHGELQGTPTVAVVLMGTNDLGYARMAAQGEDEEESVSAATPTVAKRVLLSIQHIHKESPSTQVLLVGLLPRAAKGSGPSHLAQPGLYTPAIEEVNMHFQEFATLDGRLSFVDCTQRFLINKGAAINATLMPDGLHPSGEGGQALADCILSALDPLLSGDR